LRVEYVSLLEEGLREVAWYIKKKETTLLGPPSREEAD